MRLSGLGLGWRPETARLAETRDDVVFSEIVAEQLAPERPLPLALQNLIAAGTPVIPHGIGLSIGDARGVDPTRIDALARCAERLDAPLISEHICFVRAGGRDSGHLLPLPRTADMLDILCDNVTKVMRALPVPLALENIATFFEWPDPEFDEAFLMAELHRRTGVGLMVDLANLYANQLNHGWDALEYVGALPVDAIAYTHLAGGRWSDGIYVDTHADPLPPEPLTLLEALMARGYTGGALLERDENFVTVRSMNEELDRIQAVLSSPQVQELRHVG